MALHYIVGSLDKEKNLRLTQVPELNQGESRATALRVDVPQEYADFDYYLEFFCPKNKKFIVGPLEEATDTVVENQLEYVLDGCILSDAGTVYIQLCARKEGEEQVIFKSTRSSNASFFVNKSIDADGEPYASEDMLGKLLDAFGELESTAESLDAHVQSAVAAGQYAVQVAEGLLEDKADGLFKGEKGETGPQGEKGDKGDKGEDGVKGDKGDTGATPQLSFAVTSLPPSASPTVAVSGSTDAPLVTIGIPKGEKGDKGDTGERGLQGVQGNKGDTGDVGATPSITVEAVSVPFNQNASVQKSGTDLNPVFTFSLPKGEPASMTLGNPVTGFQNGFALVSENGYLGEKKVADFDRVETIATLLKSMFSFDDTTSTLSITLNTTLL